MKPKITWIDNNGNEKSRLTTVVIPKYDEIDFGKREKQNQNKSKSGQFQSIMKVFKLFYFKFIIWKRGQTKVSISLSLERKTEENHPKRD